MKPLYLLRLTAIIMVLVFQNVISGNAQTYKTVENISYISSTEKDPYARERCVLDVYYPTDKKDFTTIVWFHGGGLSGGEKYIPEVWKEQGFAVVAVNHRLHPKVKHPIYIEDASTAVAWVFNSIAKYGGDPNKIIISGHSAGGYLTSMVGLDKSYLAKHKIDANKIAALIPFSGHSVTHFTIRKEMGLKDVQPIIDKYAPLNHVRADAPPLYLISGDRELEMLGRYEETAYMYRMMKVAGHQQTYLYELDGFDHGGMAEPGYYLTLKILKLLKL